MGGIIPTKTTGNSSQNSSWNSRAWPYMQQGANAATGMVFPGLRWVPGKGKEPGHFEGDSTSGEYPFPDRRVLDRTGDMERAYGNAWGYAGSPFAPQQQQAFDFMGGEMRGDRLAAMPYGLQSFQGMAGEMGDYGGTPSRTSVGRGSVSGIDQFTGNQMSLQDTLRQVPGISEALRGQSNLRGMMREAPSLKELMQELEATKNPDMEIPDYLKSELSYKWLDPETNPYVKANYDAAASAVGDQYSDAVAPQTAAQFALSGAFGGSAQGDTEAQQKYSFGRNLSDLASQMYGENYRSERQQYAQSAQEALALEMQNEQQNRAERSLMINMHGDQQLGQLAAWGQERGTRATSAAAQELQQLQQWAQERDSRLGAGAQAGIAELNAGTQAGIAELTAATTLADRGMQNYASNLHDWTGLYENENARMHDTAQAMTTQADLEDQMRRRRIELGLGLGATDQSLEQEQENAWYENEMSRNMFPYQQMDWYQQQLMGWMQPETSGTARQRSSSSWWE